jgi:hypothetical protein
MKLNPSRRLGLAAVAVGLASAMTVFVACSSDDNANPGPVTPFDSGPTADTYVPPVDAPVGPQPEASTADGGPSTSDGSTPDANQIVIDANLPDVGNCVSDAATCNSCYTPAQNPLNGCSPYSVNCIPFDNTRVPSGAP